MKLIVGLALGAATVWAYRSGRLQRWMGNAPEPLQQAFDATTERIGKVAADERVRDFASTVQSKVQQADAPSIVRPSASEVAGRPNEPLPGGEPRGDAAQGA